ncbi:hypothetical protein Pan1_87 [Pseudanabaena phage Pan1]|nr:hypothetical protein Pan1_87 [Pseudanabaena phage Pan1]
MRLKLINWLGFEILHRRADMTRLGRATLTSKDADEADRMVGIKHVVDYRLHIGARANVDPGKEDVARDRVFGILCHELFDDLISEIYKTEEWAFLNGYDPAICNRIRRLANLAKGQEVEDV